MVRAPNDNRNTNLRILHFGSEAHSEARSSTYALRILMLHLAGASIATNNMVTDSLYSYSIIIYLNYTSE